MTAANERLALAVVIGSTREGRRGPAIAEWFRTVAQPRGDMSLDVIDLGAARLPDILSNSRPPEVTAVAGRLDHADAFVIVTPEYNHSFPAPLKTAIDWYSAEWHAKPVGFVSYGGISGGLRAVEQLRQVFAELHAVTVRNTVSLHGVWARLGEDGTLVDSGGSEEAARAMLDQLAWWARALKEARNVRPYAAR
jgi:NAD(P)H-dependent FMN reductase